MLPIEQDPRRHEMNVLMTPDMANFSGKAHGGALLNLRDRVAFSCASALAAICGDALGRPGDVQGADPCGRARHLSRLDQPYGSHLNGGGHPRGGGEHPLRPPMAHQLLLLHHRRRRRCRPAGARAGTATDRPDRHPSLQGGRTSPRSGENLRNGWNRLPRPAATSTDPEKSRWRRSMHMRA